MDIEVLVVILLVAPILLTQGILLFIDAKKKGAYSWFWGIWGLIQFPLPSLFYYFFVIRPYRKRISSIE
jgi:hypothetical protein